MDGIWYLEGVSADGSSAVHDLKVWPFHVGREAADNSLVMAGVGLSRRHAQLAMDPAGQLWLTDLDSTNGSFVNRVRVQGSSLLKEHDVLHFAQAEFRLRWRPATALFDTPADPDRTRVVNRGLSEHFAPQEPQFLELLAGRGLSGAIQPIVQAQGGALFAHELLGRSEHPDLPRSPMHLFSLAKVMDREAELSQAFRALGIQRVAAGLPGTTLFVNTHPKETFENGFFDTLAMLPEAGVPIDLVVEVHETAVMEVPRMRELAARLKDIGVRFAYDDFGAGQARLNELGEVPAHFVKFDMGLIRDIDLASEGKQKLVRDLVRLVHELGSVALAEGVETEGEAIVCRQMGFDLIQGYLTGKPGPLPPASKA
jgi:EAL domain-containing protein (putative c-di-GMP-specific phosphodiesterase class I)